MYSPIANGPYTYKLLDCCTNELKRRLDAGRWATAADVLRDELGYLMERSHERYDGGLTAWWMQEGARTRRDWLLKHIELRALGLRLLDWHNNGGLLSVGSALVAGHTPSEDNIIQAGRELYRGSLDERALYTEMLSTLRQEGIIPTGRRISNAVEGRR